MILKSFPCDQLQLKLNQLIEEKNVYESYKTTKYYYNLLNKNPTISWDVINDICGRKKFSDEIILKSGNAYTVQYEEIANELQKEFLIHVGSNEHTVHSVYRGNNISDTLHFEEVSEDYVLNLIDNLDSSKAPGLDGIPPRVWKSLNNECFKLIAQLINRMIRNSQFPDCLKSAVIVPIFKKGDKSLAGNNRPISLLNIVSKIFEQVLYTQITAFVTLNNIYNISIWLHKSKAFDSLDHAILCDKLNYMGIRGTANQLIKDFLSNRKQSVKYKDVMSKEGDIKQGIPQGSLLGPLLFNLMISDMRFISTKCKIFKYADDALIQFTINKNYVATRWYRAPEMHAEQQRIYKID
ncbi:hypothetical protein PVAND_009093 [Polypedilum vanderplanki]|nr:hypothetical protein PVAND_009093 [Polypedilum vanderplanki]